MQLLVLAVCAAGMIPGAQEAALTGAPFIAATMVMVLPSRMAIVSTALLFVATEYATHLVDGWPTRATASAWCWPPSPRRRSGWRGNATRLCRAQDEMRRARPRGGAFPHRPRPARHLGHSLTVITVKAELAAAAARRRHRAARAELDDLEGCRARRWPTYGRPRWASRGVSLVGEIAPAR